VLESAPKVPMYRAKPPEPRWLTRLEFETLCKELPEHLELAARFAAFTEKVTNLSHKNRHTGNQAKTSRIGA
jgi:hypothetical protein